MGAAHLCHRPPSQDQTVSSMPLKKIWSEKSENRAYLPPVFPLLKILYIVSQSIADGIQDWRDQGARGQQRVSCHLGLSLLLCPSEARAGPNLPPLAVCCPMAASWGARCCPLAGRQEPARSLQPIPCQGGRKGSGAQMGSLALGAPQEGGRTVHGHPGVLQKPGAPGDGWSGQHRGHCCHPAPGHGCGLLESCRLGSAARLWVLGMAPVDGKVAGPSAERRGTAGRGGAHCQP